MKHIVCITKCYNFNDLATWVRYHDKMGYRIHLIDNDSDEIVSDCIFPDLIKGTKHTYEKLSGWPNQWQLFSDILNQNRYDFEEGDLVAFIDDDEYLWYYLDYWKLIEQHNPKFKGKVYEPMEDFVNNQMKLQTYLDLPGCVLVPQTLMSTHYFLNNRRKTESYVNTHFYRRNDASTQGKAIIKYSKALSYDFTIKTGEEYGHVPVIWNLYKNNKDTATRMSLVNGVGVSKSTYGDVDYNACLRLYHYHIKSEPDWKKKIERGSAAVDHQWYAADIHANKYFGNYDIPDFTMIETLKLLDI